MTPGEALIAYTDARARLFLKYQVTEDDPDPEPDPADIAHLQDMGDMAVQTFTEVISAETGADWSLCVEAAGNLVESIQEALSTPDVPAL